MSKITFFLTVTDEVFMLLWQATDIDEGMNAEVRYQILGGEADYFTVDPVTGHLRAVASFSHHAGHVFGFDVKATDRAGAHDGRSAIANVFVSSLLPVMSTMSSGSPTS